MDIYGVEKAGRFGRCFSDMIRIQLDLWIRPLDLESGSRSRQPKLTHKKVKCMLGSAGCYLRRSEGFFCILEVLHGGSIFLSKIATMLGIQGPVIFDPCFRSRDPEWTFSYIFFNIMKYMDIKKDNLFFPLFFCIVVGSGMKKSGSGTNIPDPQHCISIYRLYPFAYMTDV